MPGHLVPPDALTWTSAGSDDADAPTVVLLHGYGADEDDLVALVEHLPDGLRFESLRAPLSLPQHGYAWFELDELPLTSRTRLASDHIAAHTELVLTWLDEHVQPQGLVVPLGFSQGGLMASQLLRTAPDRFAGAVICSGFVLSDEQPGDRRLADLRLPVWFGYGTADPLVSADAFEQVDQVLRRLTTLTVMSRPGLGHGLDMVELGAISQFLTTLTRRR